VRTRLWDGSRHGAAADVEVEFIDADGTLRRESLSGCWHVAFERVAAQPMWLRGTVESGRSVRHAPDYLGYPILGDQSRIRTGRMWPWCRMTRCRIPSCLMYPTGYSPNSAPARSATAKSATGGNPATPRPAIARGRSIVGGPPARVADAGTARQPVRACRSPASRDRACTDPLLGQADVDDYLLAEPTMNADHITACALSAPRPQRPQEEQRSSRARSSRAGTCAPNCPTHSGQSPIAHPRDTAAAAQVRSTEATSLQRGLRHWRLPVGAGGRRLFGRPRAAGYAYVLAKGIAS
jgi:hypothetical protein